MPTRPTTASIGGDRESLLDAIYAAWKADVAAGKVEPHDRRGQRHRRRAEPAGEDSVAWPKARSPSAGVVIADGQRAGVGDEIVTRQNNRLLTTGKSWVKNGDRFVVAATNPDGSMAVRRVSGGAEVVLPADYVAQHVELAYATTSYRSQGRTVDTTHSLVSPTTTREVLYVAATRGRESNMVYVDTSFDPDPATGHDGTIAQQSASEVLAGVLANEGADLSAHEALERAQHHMRGLQRPRRRVRDPGPRRSTATLGRPAGSFRTRTSSPRAGPPEPSYGPLLAAFATSSPGVSTCKTSSRSSSRPAPSTMPRIRPPSCTPAWTAGQAQPPQDAGSYPDLVAGMIPRARGVSDKDMARALQERDEAMARRARELALKAAARGEAWITQLGAAPTDPVRREMWLAALSTLAAYRDRWKIGEEHGPLGLSAELMSKEQTRHRDRALVAIHTARRLSRGQSEPSTPTRPDARTELTSERPGWIAM